MPVRLISTQRFVDDRGWFSEVYNRDNFSALGLNTVFVQDNHSMSRVAGVLRGLHFQRPPHAQAKLVRCVRGRVWDVAVDIRSGSPTYGKWVSRELSPENGLQLFIPTGFAHGFLALEPQTEVAYKTSDVYAPDCDGGLIWNDPDIAIRWPLGEDSPLLSDKDRELKTLAEFASPFAYDGTPLGELGA
jgi:dTDP-4-dehydrorhamnose 3,5-epimerase